MFRQILLATDFSDASERAGRLAAELARASSARLIVLHVYEVSTQTLADTPADEAERTWPGVTRARRRLDRVIAELLATGLRAEGIVRVGAVPARIAQVALGEGVDLIVTGTHGRRGFARVWWGSVAEQVLRCSIAPVLAVPVEQSNLIQVRFR